MRRLPVLPVVLLAACALPAPAAAAPAFTNFHFNSPTGTPRAVTAGPDGNVWFTDDQDPNHVGRITPGGTAKEWAVTHDAQVGEITAGPNGLWFTETGKNAVGRISTLGAVREFPVDHDPAGIAVGPDGNLWITETEGDGAIARITTGGTVTVVTAGLSKKADPTDIVKGPDGRLWFTETGAGKVGAITTQGVITEYAVSGTPQQITVGPDGNLWFTETGAAPAIGRITPAGAVLGDFPVTLGAPQGIATGADGNVYYTNPATNAIGQVTPAGTVTELSAGITAGAGLTDITSGPDGRIWFAEHTAGGIGRMIVASAAGAGTDDGSATPAAAGAGDTPVAPASPAALPTLGTAVVGAKTTGSVLVRLPGQTAYTALAAGDSVPVGSVVDATNGAVTMTSALDGRGRTQNGRFWGGRFTVRQAADEKGIVEIGLVGTPAGCGKGVARAAAKKRPVRIWGQDDHGKFRTRGRYSAATVRGTKWLTTETCAGTRTTVAAGAVDVWDRVRHRRVTVRAGHSYLARAPRS